MSKMEIVDGRVRLRAEGSASWRTIQFLLWHKFSIDSLPIPVDWGVGSEFAFSFTDTETRKFVTMFSPRGVLGGSQDGNIINIAFKEFQCIGVSIFQIENGRVCIPSRGSVRVSIDGDDVTAGFVNCSAFDPTYSFVPRWNSYAKKDE